MGEKPAQGGGTASGWGAGGCGAGSGSVPAAVCRPTRTMRATLSNASPRLSSMDVPAGGVAGHGDGLGSGRDGGRRPYSPTTAQVQGLFTRTSIVCPPDTKRHKYGKAMSGSCSSGMRACAFMWCVGISGTPVIAARALAVTMPTWRGEAKGECTRDCEHSAWDAPAGRGPGRARR